MSYKREKEPKHKVGDRVIVFEIEPSFDETAIRGEIGEVVQIDHHTRVKFDSSVSIELQHRTFFIHNEVMLLSEWEKLPELYRLLFI